MCVRSETSTQGRWNSAAEAAEEEAMSDMSRLHLLRPHPAADSHESCKRDLADMTRQRDELVAMLNSATDIGHAVMWPRDRDEKTQVVVITVHGLDILCSHAAVSVHLRRQRNKALRLLSELHTLVMGECPSLLSEDSGGDAALDTEIRAALAAKEPSDE